MPTLDIRTYPLTKEERHRVSTSLYEVMKEVVGDRVIDIYISAYESFYRKAVDIEEPSALISVLGAITINRHDFEILTKKVYQEFIKAVNKPDMNVTFSYSLTDQDHLAGNGVLLSDFPINRLVK
ncbi:hypothetical protein OXPF_13640 [Oxobacter pfennigii]|uniref:Tautomerase enzyme n=1 Tax=Oxobacter pfennigii TaxID=36849 RepID=A0A0P8X248_9CLOT|nr:hypothetical protein [Oxobacter pfennigii]KPU44886.1 hypothetical protein OXPF_13640 [Oxobacter pfennigii]